MEIIIDYPFPGRICCPICVPRGTEIESVLLPGSSRIPGYFTEHAKLLKHLKQRHGDVQTSVGYKCARCAFIGSGKYPLKSVKAHCARMHPVAGSSSGAGVTATANNLNESDECVFVRERPVNSGAKNAGRTEVIVPSSSVPSSSARVRSAGDAQECAASSSPTVGNLPTAGGAVSSPSAVGNLPTVGGGLRELPARTKLAPPPSDGNSSHRTTRPDVPTLASAASGPRIVVSDGGQLGAGSRRGDAPRCIVKSVVVIPRGVDARAACVSTSSNAGTARADAPRGNRATFDKNSSSVSDRLSERPSAATSGGARTAAASNSINFIDKNRTKNNRDATGSGGRKKSNSLTDSTGVAPIFSSVRAAAGAPKLPPARGKLSLRRPLGTGANVRQTTTTTRTTTTTTTVVVTTTTTTKTGRASGHAEQGPSQRRVSGESSCKQGTSGLQVPLGQQRPATTGGRSPPQPRPSKETTATARTARTSPAGANTTTSGRDAKTPSPRHHVAVPSPPASSSRPFTRSMARRGSSVPADLHNVGRSSATGRTRVKMLAAINEPGTVEEDNTSPRTIRRGTVPGSQRVPTTWAQVAAISPEENECRAAGTPWRTPAGRGGPRAVARAVSTPVLAGTQVVLPALEYPPLRSPPTIRGGRASGGCALPVCSAAPASLTTATVTTSCVSGTPVMTSMEGAPGRAAVWRLPSSKPPPLPPADVAAPPPEGTRKDSDKQEKDHNGQHEDKDNERDNNGDKDNGAREHRWSVAGGSRRRRRQRGSFGALSGIGLPGAADAPRRVRLSSSSSDSSTASHP